MNYKQRAHLGSALMPSPIIIDHVSTPPGESRSLNCPWDDLRLFWGSSCCLSWTSWKIWGHSLDSCEFKSNAPYFLASFIFLLVVEDMLEWQTVRTKRHLNHPLFQASLFLRCRKYNEWRRFLQADRAIVAEPGLWCRSSDFQTGALW